MRYGQICSNPRLSPALLALPQPAHFGAANLRPGWDNCGVDSNQPQPAQPDPVKPDQLPPSKSPADMTLEEWSNWAAQLFVESLNKAALRDEPKP